MQIFLQTEFELKLYMYHIYAIFIYHFVELFMILQGDRSRENIMRKTTSIASC